MDERSVRGPIGIDRIPPGRTGSGGTAALSRRRSAARAVALLLAAIAATPLAAAPEREQNELEATYSIIAKGTGLAQFCARIYPYATHGLGFNPAGFQTYYTRSQCYLDVAARTGDRSLCDQVRSHRTLFLDGSGISRSECLKSAGSLKPAAGAGAHVDFIFAKPILTQMGYTEAMIPPALLGASDESQMWLDFLDAIAPTLDFAARIDRLPDFTNVPVYRNTRTCERPFLLTPQNFPPPDDMDCCMDIDGSGVCDEKEFKADHASGKNIVLESTAGRPPTSLCGDRPFDVALVVHNRGLWPIRPNSGWVQLFADSPAVFGRTAADFYKPMPAIPAGGSAVVAFEGLRYSTAPGVHVVGYPLRADACLSSADGECTQVLDLHVAREREDASPCVAERALRRPGGPCRGPFVADPDAPAGPGSVCCLDSDRDGRCDDREWQASRAHPESIRMAFSKEKPGLTAREGEPFSIPVKVRNVGAVPLNGHDGVIYLLLGRSRLIPADESVLFAPLPTLEPGAETVLTFGGLRFVPNPGDYPSQGAAVEALLCMRGGCGREDAVSVTLMVKDAEAKIAARAAEDARRRAASPRSGRRQDGRVWSQVDYNVWVLSTLDPLATAVVGQPAPDFSTTDTEGRFFRLGTLRKTRNALLVFCPDAASAACRDRLVALRDRRSELERMEVGVWLVTDAPVPDLVALRARQGPGFQALVDPGLRISACYARREEGDRGTPRPLIVLVDKAGDVRLKADDAGPARVSSADLMRSIGALKAATAR